MMDYRRQRTRWGLAGQGLVRSEVVVVEPPVVDDLASFG